MSSAIMTNYHTKKPRKSGWLWAAAVIVVVIITVPLLIQDRNGNRLLARAQRVGVGVGHYQWLTDHDIVYTEIWRTAKSHNRIVKRNVETGVISPVRAFQSNQRNFAIRE